MRIGLTARCSSFRGLPCTGQAIDRDSEEFRLNSVMNCSKRIAVLFWLLLLMQLQLLLLLGVAHSVGSSALLIFHDDT